MFLNLKLHFDFFEILNSFIFQANYFHVRATFEINQLFYSSTPIALTLYYYLKVDLHFLFDLNELISRFDPKVKIAKSASANRAFRFSNRVIKFDDSKY